MIGRWARLLVATLLLALGAWATASAHTIAWLSAVAAIVLWGGLLPVASGQ
jgi:hypothetical protein